MISSSSSPPCASSSEQAAPSAPPCCSSATDPYVTVEEQWRAMRDFKVIVQYTPVKGDTAKGSVAVNGGKPIQQLVQFLSKKLGLGSDKMLELIVKSHIVLEPEEFLSDVYQMYGSENGMAVQYGSDNRLSVQYNIVSLRS
uniref:Ubiquitin-like domain-containing protein n=1 Tax=Chromera velia CCMP2878 TaxID=1169474 RepID=A0A0G4GWD9_9ALVE|mmetsp:Transcript_53433/g.104520  ORF Transcript_53433/g.104520 Transcript_53433/m.104520 type:complete len:141 (-) Transcript_53433:24-446(-)|eukprot:Cvel_23682.t1-p1 / transcript=Cvel_23682.t1 / gene=Cvel_23682 / organism=Chromera_velia_CCMP2878 / gene_product=hypothetical protein / transcript_product=hypothetical protein / location=Cvel_scaffold2469:12222-15486(-) / protein_length=140 / sequence_SO=supercontig / SO=protein_coding / is_pseudo=false